MNGANQDLTRPAEELERTVSSVSPIVRPGETQPILTSRAWLSPAEPSECPRPDILLLAPPSTDRGSTCQFAQLTEHAPGRVLLAPASEGPDSRLRSRLSLPTLRLLGDGRIRTVVMADDQSDSRLVRQIQGGFGIRVVIHACRSELGPDRGLSEADRIIASSRFVRSRLIEAHGLDPPCVTVVPTGIDAMAFTPVHARDRKRAPILLASGDLVPGNGIALLLRALPKLVRALPTLHCHVLGNGPEQPALARQAAALGLAGHVHFLGQPWQEAMPSFYADADLFVLPGNEPGDTALLQAAAAGLPIVAVDQGSNPEIVREGENGLLFDGGDPDELADLALLVLQNHSLARTMGHRGRAVARAHDWGAISDRFLAVCDGRS
jgi:glycosyltransferase involved in cell wall biosynthesis